MIIWFPQRWCARAYTVVLVVVTLIISVGFYWFLAPFVFADVVSDEMMPEFAIPGYAQGQAMTFSVDDSGYHDITVTSDVLIDATVLSMPGMIEMSFKRVTSPSTFLTITNLAPNHEYQMYLDGYENHSTFITDNTGAFSFSFDLTEPRYVIIQEHTSTIFLQNDTIGGDCELIGIWNDTDNICTMTRNATDTVQFSSDGITLDGGGFTLAGPDSGNGIFIANRSDVTVRNIVIENFSNAIRLSNGAGQRFENITVQNSRYGINANNTQDTLVDNSIFDTTFTIGVWFSSMNNANVVDSMFVNNSGVYALHIIDSSSTFVRDNTFTPITQNAISHIDSTDSILRRNTMTGAGILFDGETDMHHQNDIDTSNTVDGRAVLYLQDEQNVVFNNTENAAQIFCSFCENVTLQNFSPAPYYTGIYLWDTRDSVVTGNTLTGNAFGVTFLNSGDNEVMRNSFSDNSNDINIASGAASENNVIYRNNFLEPKSPVRIRVANTNSPIFKSLPDGGNYWSEYDEPGEGCNDGNNDLRCDQAFNLGLPGGVTLVDQHPWTDESTWELLEPALFNLEQFKIFGVDPIKEGGEFVGNVAVFKAEISEPGGGDVRLEVEVKSFDEPFDGTLSTSSAYVPSGTVASTTVPTLIPKDEHYVPGGNQESFHWRARTRASSTGEVSPWKEFGAATSTGADFSVKVVPLVTQVQSDFPSQAETEEWENKIYADQKGKNECGDLIRQCACVLSSLDMLGEYYGEYTGIDGSTINPLTFDAWLLKNAGYNAKGNIVWARQAEYFGFHDGTATQTKLSLTDGKKDIPYGSSFLDQDLEEKKPIMAYSDTYKHYFIVDNKITKTKNGLETYTLRDPRWHGTKTLSDKRNLSREIINYNNIFNEANRFIHTPGGIKYAKSINIYLASPAELLVTDPQGRKLGLDPIASTTYTEIPEGIYGFDNSIQSSTTPRNTELTKEIQIFDPLDGEYQIQVIGTGVGSYTLTVASGDDFGGSRVQEIVASTTVNQQDGYVLNYTPQIPSEIMVISQELEPTVEELFANLQVITKESKIKPRFLKLLIRGKVILAEYLYANGNASLAKKTLKKLKKVVKAKKGNGITKKDAKEMIRIINQLLVALS